MHVFIIEKLGCYKKCTLALAACVTTSALLLSFPSQGFGDGYIDLRPKMTAVKSQGQRNTCNVFAATAIMEFLLKKKLNREIDLSEAYNYWAAKKYTLNTPFLKQAYAHIDGLAGFLAVEAYKYGSMLEDDWPYAAKNWKQRKDKRCRYVNGNPIPECYTGTPPRNAKRLNYAIKPQYVDRRQIARFISRHKKPVLMNMLWCGPAVNNQTGKVRMPTSAEAREATTKHRGHVITLVGYFPDSKHFIFKNSNGPGWGKKGYGIIPERYVVDYCEACPKLKNINSMPEEQRRFWLKAAMGVSGRLK